MLEKLWSGDLLLVPWLGSEVLQRTPNTLHFDGINYERPHSKVLEASLPDVPTVFHFNGLSCYSLFFPNSGSIFTSTATTNPGIVAAITQRKKF